MPIRPENKHRYPKDWKKIRASILKRAGNKCEQCGVPNGWVRNNATGEVTNDGLLADTWFLSDENPCAKIVLTIAHLDHKPENNDPANLRAWCQRCHNQYDAPMRAAGIKARRRAKNAIGDLL